MPNGAANVSRATERVAAAALLFGTDSSFFPRGWQRAVYDAQRDALARAGANEEVRSSVFGGNFERLFPA